MHRVEVNALPPSLNKFYSGMHWTKRASMVDEWHGLFRAALQDAKVKKKLVTPLSLNVTQFCSRIVRDVDNGIISAKLFADALKLYGYIPNDTPEFIQSVILQSKKGKEDKIVITF